MAPAPSPERGQHTFIRDLSEVAAIAAVLYVLIAVCIQTVKVDGTSMVNTLQNGDLLIASKISYVFSNPERGDIVILTPPPYCDTNPNDPACAPGQPPQHDFIKRVMGLPGDKLEIDGNTSPTSLLIEPGGIGPWTRVAEPYLPENWDTATICCQPNGTVSSSPQPFQIPAGQYFVMGDNRNHSDDSRFLGLIPRNKIQAKAVLRIYPFANFGGLGPGPTLVTLPALPSVAIVFSRRKLRRIRRQLLGLRD